MISDVHYIELYIHGDLVELESQDSLNLRINNVIFNPTKTSTSQAEYSYSFNIPSTPNNDKILNFANNLSRINKFHARYSAQVYADGALIFDGSLTVNKYSAKDKMYECNLVNIKINTLEEIFGDTMMTDLKWMIDFEGGSTINSVNADMNSKYWFPLVSYGVFQKNYVTKDEVSATYTPKHDIDKYNKWWVESFYPSLNMVETMRKAFENKGYTVGGSVFSDPFISNIYTSCNLAQEQVPQYNLGRNLFGYCDISFTWNNYGSLNNSGGGFGSGNTFSNSTGGIPQDLKLPYGMVKPAINASNSNAQEEYNFSTVNIWNMLDSTNNPSGVTVSVNYPTYMYDPNEQLIVIPSDGWYKIFLNVTCSLSGQGTTFNADQWTTTFYEGDEFKQRSVQFTRGLKEHTPLEIQLIRNYNENVELIKGTKNVTYATGDVNQETYTIRGNSYTGGTYTNRSEWNTDFPHQNLYASKAPTKTDGLVNTITQSTASGGWNPATDGHANGTFGNFTRGGSVDGDPIASQGASASNTYGYMHRSGYIMPYDQAVSPSFICGFSSLGDGTVSVMRNGKSWSKMCSINNKIFAKVKGMDLVNKTEGGATEVIETEYCKNDYTNASHSLTVTDSNMSGILTCCVYLNKNDILEVVAVQRDFDNHQRYATSANCRIAITAMSDRSEVELRADPEWQYYSNSEFPRYLNLFNFTNKETKVSDWIGNIQKAFNLEITQEGNSIMIDTNQGVKKNINYAVDIDDRVSSSEAESEYISYPREMSVRYKIDTDEYGFELTVPQEHINDEDWEKWGDSGFTVINLSDDSYETSSQNTQTNFSYTYYDNFVWKEVLQNGTETSNTVGITIPVIEKSEFMAEGYGYEDAMKHDGYSFTQRFWYRQPPSSQYVWLSSHMVENVFLSYPINMLDGFNLSYKDTETSIVTEYFNISPMLSSNYVNVETYLTPKEYNEIKGGALVHFDSDLYYTSEISGYDPSGGNTTKLKLIKKV